MTIVDAHLDLSYNAVRGRDVLRPALEQAADEEGIPTVGFPDLAAGHVRLVCATIFCLPNIPEQAGYKTADEAYAAAREQLAWYQSLEQTGRLRFVKDGNDPALRIDGSLEPIPQNAILLLEGADPIRSVDELPSWVEAGLRIIGLAWRQTRFAGGTGAPGPLTEEGVALVHAMDKLGLIHDASHLAEQSFWQLVEISDGPMIASHSNCRAIVPTDRQLSDEMIRAIAARGGVIGINFFDKFLIPPDHAGKRRATLDDVIAHIRHIANLLGQTTNIGLGTDMDGGLGRLNIPQEIVTSADLPKLADALSTAGFSSDDIAGIMGQNWQRYFARTLPAR